MHGNMNQFLEDIAANIRNQTISGIATFILGSLVLWLGLSADRVRNVIVSFITDPNNFLIDMMGLTVLASIPLVQEFYRTHCRNYSIRNGADIIFENKPSQFVLHIIKDWAGSTDELDLFNEQRNYQRIKSDSDNGRLKLTHSSLSENNIIDPVYQMILGKAEFIRWLRNERELPIPRLWRKRS